MSVISVQKLVSDYCDLNIYQQYRRQNDKFTNGLLKILANNAIEIELKDPEVYRKDWDKLMTRYKRIVEKIDLSLTKKRDKFSQFDDKKLASIFFSPEEFSSLLKAEKESR